MCVIQVGIIYFYNPIVATNLKIIMNDELAAFT